MSTEHNLAVQNIGELQNRNGIFFIAVAVLSVGYALTQTKVAGFSFSQIPLLIALYCWSSSFYQGCCLIQSNQSVLMFNADLVIIRSEHEHPYYRYPEKFKNEEEITDEMYRLRKEVSEVSDAQFKHVLAGIVFYIIWHLLEILYIIRI
jgi:hypothetical protein